MKRTMLALGLLLLMPIRPATAEILVDCWDDPGFGDGHDRGLYVTDYPGTTLDQVDLFLTLDSAGTCTIRMTARADTYDGPLIGVDEITGDYPVHPADPADVSFMFDGAAVTPGSIVTFALEVVSGPFAYYHVASFNPDCPVVQTNGTTPPLDSPRGNDICIRIHGDETTAAERAAWSVVKGIYR